MSDSLSGPIAMILAHARSGALDRAWQMFEELDLDQRRDDPAVLTLHARLLKDRARRASGQERRLGYLAAAKAYREAAELSPASYPLINAATLLRLAGMPEQAAALAADLLTLLDQGSDISESETPYYREATRAEALLLCGQFAQAQQSLEQAIALAPLAWEDHATTLRQFALILTEGGASTDWLDAFRPPRAAHFAGSMRLPSDDAQLIAAIEQWIADERVGFGFGALAAGADIVIAEAMARAGVELHILLPAPREAFVAASVRPFGDDWEARFDALMDKAESVREIDEGVAAIHPSAIALADSIAMGMAVIKARQFETEAIQLVVTARNRAGSHSERVRRSWGETGRRQHHLAIDWQDDATDRASAPGDYRLITVLALAFAPAQSITRHGTADLLIEHLPILAQILSSHRPLVNLGWFDRTLLLAYTGPAEAARAAKAIVVGTGPGPLWRIAGHIGILRPVEDPISGRRLLFGHAVGVTLQILRAVPEGAVIVSDAFAAVLNAGDGPGDSEPVGELEPEGLGEPIGLWALRL